MKLTSMALASAFRALQHLCIGPHSFVTSQTSGTHPMHSDATPSVVLHPKYSNRKRQFSVGTGAAMCGATGAPTMGPMIPTGAGG